MVCVLVRYTGNKNCINDCAYEFSTVIGLNIMCIFKLAQTHTEPFYTEWLSNSTGMAMHKLR